MTTIAFIGGALLGFCLGLLTSISEDLWYRRGLPRARPQDDGTADGVDR